MFQGDLFRPSRIWRNHRKPQGSEVRSAWLTGPESTPPAVAFQHPAGPEALPPVRPAWHSAVSTPSHYCRHVDNTSRCCYYSGECRYWCCKSIRSSNALNAMRLPAPGGASGASWGHMILSEQDHLVDDSMPFCLQPVEVDAV